MCEYWVLNNPSIDLLSARLRTKVRDIEVNPKSDYIAVAAGDTRYESNTMSDMSSTRAIARRRLR